MIYGSVTCDVVYSRITHRSITIEIWQTSPTTKHWYSPVKYRTRTLRIAGQCETTKHYYGNMTNITNQTGTSSKCLNDLRVIYRPFDNDRKTMKQSKKCFGLNKSMIYAPCNTTILLLLPYCIMYIIFQTIIESYMHLWFIYDYNTRWNYSPMRC